MSNNYIYPPPPFRLLSLSQNSHTYVETVVTMPPCQVVWTRGESLPMLSQQ